MQKEKSVLISANHIYQAYRINREIIKHTPLHKSIYLSNKYQANIYLKREDLQVIRSFKIRGASNAFRKLTEEEKQRGVVTASAGNHAQGIAYCCHKLRIKGTIFMPSITPKLKVKSVINFGGEWLDVILIGNSFDDAVNEAKKFQLKTNANVIQGQGGLAVEILEDQKSMCHKIDYVFTCCGGGGLASGIACYLRQMTPEIKVLGFQPMGSPSMYNSLKVGHPITLDILDTFVDGASMKKTGQIPFSILKQLQLELHLVAQGLVATTMMNMYDYEAIILQPAGALSVSGLELLHNQIKGKTIVCILSGSNNDITRLPQIRLRSRIYLKKQAYYMISSQMLINVILMVQTLIMPEQQDIIFINSSKKYNTSANQCALGICLNSSEFKDSFEQRITNNGYRFHELQANDPLLKIFL